MTALSPLSKLVDQTEQYVMIQHLEGSDPPIDERVRPWLSALLPILMKQWQLPGVVSFHLAPSTVIASSLGSDEMGFAAFVPGMKGIIVASVRLPDLSFEEWLEQLTYNVVHELAHYRQLLEGKFFEEGTQEYKELSAGETDALEREAEKLADEWGAKAWKMYQTLMGQASSGG